MDGQRTRRFAEIVICTGIAAVLSPSPAIADGPIKPFISARAIRSEAAAPVPAADAARSDPLFSVVPRDGPVLLSRAGLSAATASAFIDGRRFSAMAPVPPDPTGAIGGRYYVEAVSDRVAVYRRRDLRLVSQLNANRFWHIDPFPTMDPQITWDAESRRWYASSMDKARDRLLFGWSKGADPRDLRRGWCQFRAPRVGGAFPDFPMLGFSRRHMVIGANMFDSQTKEFVSSRIFAIAAPPKGSSGCGRPALLEFGSKKHPLRQADGHIAFTPVPARELHPTDQAWILAADCPTSDAPDTGEESCEHVDPGVNEITTWRIGGPRNSPKLVEVGGVSIPSFREPRPVPQPRTKNKIDPSDTRLSLAVSNRDPSLGGVDAVWVAHAVAGAHGRAVARWYELDPAQLTVLRSGTIQRANNWAIYPAISPTFSGDEAALNYIAAGRRLRPQLRVSYRAAGDPPGTMGRDTLLAQSKRKVGGRQCEEKVCRYGDYAGASADAKRSSTVWGTNEVIGRKLNAPRRDWPNWKTLNFAVHSGP